MTKKELWRLSHLLLAAAATAFAAAPAHAQNDWWRRQQQQQQQQQQQRQHQQQEMDRQRRQQQQQEQRRQQQLQEQQRIRQQMQEQIQRDIRARMQREQQQRQAQQRQGQQQQQRNRASEAGARLRGDRAGGGSVVGRRNERAASSAGVARLGRAPTTAEMRRGFTGRVTSDGRALVKVGGRVLAVPAARIGVRVNRVQSPSVASRWNASRRAAVTAEVQKLASTRPTRRAAAGGGGGRKPPTGGGGDGGEPPRWNRANVQFGQVADNVSHTFRHTDGAGLDREVVKEAVLSDLEKIGHFLPEKQHHNGFVFINGSPWQYRAFKLPGGVINVGSISPPSTRR